MKGKHDKILFECHKHDTIHEFYREIRQISDGCPFGGCRPYPQNFCGAIECSSCTDNSVAGLELVRTGRIIFSSSNLKQANFITRRSNIKYLWECPNHIFLHQWSRGPETVFQGSGCPYPPCAITVLKICDHEECEDCDKGS